MKKTVMVLLLTAGLLYAAELPRESQGNLSINYTRMIAKTTELDSLSLLLEKAYTELYQPDSDAIPDLYLTARSRIATCLPGYNKAPLEPASREVFASCSLLTAGAVMQLIEAKYDRDIKIILAKRVAVLTEIKAIHEKINDVERSKASEIANRLQSDLTALQDEADKKFKELQSSLIQVTSDARGTIISMSDILFETGKANLTADLKTSLAKIAGILIVFKTSNVIVEGHTDNVGSDEYNQVLSEKRAENVMNFLIEQGVAASRLTAIGYGLSHPIAENETKEGRAKNRRVDLIVQEDKVK